MRWPDRPATGPRQAAGRWWWGRRRSSWSMSGGAVDEVGDGEPEPQAASTSGAATTAINPNCSRRPGFLRIAASIAATGGRYGAPMATTSDITYETDGRTMVGTLALPDGTGTDQRPGVLVCHEGPGLDDHARDRAKRIADELGYVAFALDYHGAGKPIGDREQMMARIGELRSDPARAFAIGASGLDILRAEPRCDPGKPGRHRLLLRRDALPGAGPGRRRPQGRRRLPLRALHGAPRGRP